MKHERDEIARHLLPSPRYDERGYIRKDNSYLLIHYIKPQPITETAAVSVPLHTIRLERRYLSSGECVWYEPADNNR